MNYYNEYDPYAAAWLRELIEAGEIPRGEVDERSITAVTPSDLVGFTQCHWFAGVGGWSRALRIAGIPDDYPLWTGSCPCQPFSAAGKGKGTADERHLWPVFAELIGACQPATVFGEQVASKAGREWLAGVFADLERMGYQRAGADLCAASVGAPHIRQRMFWVANADCECLSAAITHTTRPRNSGRLGGLYDAISHGRQSSRNDNGQNERIIVTAASETDGLFDANGTRSQSGLLAAATARHWCTAQSAGCAGGLSNANPGERERLTNGERRIGNGTAPGWQQSYGEPKSNCEPDGLSDSQRPRLEGYAGNGDHGDKSRRLGEIPTRPATLGSWSSRVGNAESDRPEMRALVHGEVRGQGLGERCGYGHWNEFDIIPFRDGKYRRVERGTFPLVTRSAQSRTESLVDGLFGGVVSGGDPSAQEVQATAEARVMRLKGYGNAIVPQLAAVFIQAYFEARELA